MIVLAQWMLWSLSIISTFWIWEISHFVSRGRKKRSPLMEAESYRLLLSLSDSGAKVTRVKYRACFLEVAAVVLGTQLSTKHRKWHTGWVVVLVVVWLSSWCRSDCRTRWLSRIWWQRWYQKWFSHQSRSWGVCWAWFLERQSWAAVLACPRSCVLCMILGGAFSVQLAPDSFWSLHHSLLRRGWRSGSLYWMCFMQWEQRFPLLPDQLLS